MNKQYVLIQEYPGSPTIGTKAKLTDYNSLLYRTESGRFFLKTHLENHPKYWDLVEEELCVPIGTKIRHCFLGDIRTITKVVDKVIYFKSKHGEEFRTGLNVKGANKYIKEGVFHWIIVEDEVKEGSYITFLRDFDASKAMQTVQVSAIQKDSSSTNGWITYSNPKRRPVGGGFRWKDSKSNGYELGVDFRLATPEEISATKPLFTTEDGKEIYQGDSWWYVIPSKLIVKQTSTTTYKGKNTSNDEIKRFSTEALAKEYLVRERPCVTIKFAKGRLTQEQFSKLTTQVSTREILNIISEI